MGSISQGYDTWRGGKKEGSIITREDKVKNWTFFKDRRVVHNIGQWEVEEKGAEGVGEAGIADGIRSHSKKRGNRKHGGEIDLGQEGGLNPLNWKVCIQINMSELTKRKAEGIYTYGLGLATGYKELWVNMAWGLFPSSPSLHLHTI